MSFRNCLWSVMLNFTSSTQTILYFSTTVWGCHYRISATSIATFFWWPGERLKHGEMFLLACPSSWKSQHHCQGWAIQSSSWLCPVVSFGITVTHQFCTLGIYIFPDFTCFSFCPSQIPIRTILKCNWFKIHEICILSKFSHHFSSPYNMKQHKYFFMFHQH